MQAKQKEIDTLRKLQEVDRQALTARKKFQELPQRQELAALQDKKTAVTAKSEQVEHLLSASQKDISRLDAETEILKLREEETQRKINELQGDYRSVDSLTKDLNGMEKRIEKIEFDRKERVQNQEQIELLKIQIEDALTSLDSQIHTVSKSLEDDSAALKQTIETATLDHRVLAEKLPDDLLDLYAKTIKRCGGVALATLEDSHCSTCRSAIEDNRLLQIKRDAPISECPHCHRLLIIEEE